MTSGNTGGGGGGSKTQTILGFLFDFRSNAGKVFKSVRQELTKTTKSWGSGFTKLAKVFKHKMLMMGGSLNLFHEDLKRRTPKIADLVNQIGDSMGGVAGLVADTLTRPGALLAAVGGVALKAGMDMEKSMVTMRRETALSAEELAKYRDSIVEVSKSLDAPMSQVEALAKSLSSANINQGEFTRLSKIAIQVNRLSGVETSELGEQIKRMAINMKMSAQEVRDYYNVVHGTSKATKVTIQDMIVRTEQFADVIKNSIPDNFAAGMQDAAKIAGYVGNSFEAVEPMIGKFFQSIGDRSSEEFKQFRTVASMAGADTAAAFSKAAEDGRYMDAFRNFHKGIISMSKDQIKNAFDNSKAWEQAFGISRSAITSFRDLSAATADQVDQLSEVSKAMDTIAKETVENRTLGEKWRAVWSKLERIALPFGEKLVEWLGKALDLMSAILSPIESLISGLGDGMKTALLLVGGFFALRAPIAAALGLVQIMSTSTVGLLKNVYNVGAAFLGVARNASVAKVAIDAATGTTMGLSAAGVGATGVFRGLAGSIAFAGKALGRLLWPLALITTAISILDGLFKELFNVSFMEMFGLALDAIGWVLGQIGWVVGKIVKGIAWLLTGGNIDFDKPIVDAKKLVDKDSKTIGAVAESSDGAATVADSAQLRPEFGSGLAQEDVKKLGDRIIDGQYGSADYLAKQLAVALANFVGASGAQRASVAPLPRHNRIQDSGSGGGGPR